jgi:hypothetical protein
MEQENIALDLLASAVLNKHQAMRQSSLERQDSDFVDFTDDEVISMVESLWVDRYTTSRKKFEETVGGCVGRLVSEK